MSNGQTLFNFNREDPAKVVGNDITTRPPTLLVEKFYTKKFCIRNLREKSIYFVWTSGEINRSARCFSFNRY